MFSHEDGQPSLGHTLGHAANLCRERMSARVCRFDVTPVQFRVLLCLHQHEGKAQQNQVAQYLCVRPSTANGILNRMEEKGFICRTISGDDARRRLISLTELGAERYTQLTESFSSAEKVMTQNLSPEELQALQRLLDKVIQNLEEDRIHDETSVASCQAICKMDRRRRDLQRGGGNL